VSFKGRIRRAEDKAGGTLPCPTCGYPPEMGGLIVFSDQGEGFPDDPDERCSGCGRRLWFVVEICGPAERGEGADFIEVADTDRGRG
jgi:hypothetical protein